MTFPLDFAGHMLKMTTPWLNIKTQQLQYKSYWGCSQSTPITKSTEKGIDLPPWYDQSLLAADWWLYIPNHQLQC